MASGDRTAKWMSVGYQAAMRDLRNALVRGGAEGMCQWLMDNYGLSGSDTELHDSIRDALTQNEQ